MVDGVSFRGPTGVALGIAWLSGTERSQSKWCPQLPKHLLDDGAGAIDRQERKRQSAYCEDLIRSYRCIDAARYVIDVDDVEEALPLVNPESRVERLMRHRSQTAPALRDPR